MFQELKKNVPGTFSSFLITGTLLPGLWKLLKSWNRFLKIMYYFIKLVIEIVMTQTAISSSTY